MATLADVFRAIHSLQTEGIIENYAVGGTIAALFGAEATLCFEVSVCTPDMSGYWVVHGVPIFFFNPQNLLESEAVRLANTLTYDDVSVRVMSFEHLLTFYLHDRKSRWGYSPSYFAPDKVNQGRIDEVAESAGLLSVWRKWQEEEQVGSPDAHRYAAKKRWHEENARLPVKEKVAQLLHMQQLDLPIIAARRELKWWEKPWDIEP